MIARFPVSCQRRKELVEEEDMKTAAIYVYYSPGVSRHVFHVQNTAMSEEVEAHSGILPAVCLVLI